MKQRPLQQVPTGAKARPRAGSFALDCAAGIRCRRLRRGGAVPAPRAASRAGHARGGLLAAQRAGAHAEPPWAVCRARRRRRVPARPVHGLRRSQEYTHDWSDRRKLLHAVARVVRTVAAGGMAHRCVSPFNALVYPLAAPLALLVARSAAAHLVAAAPRAHPPLRPAGLASALHAAAAVRVAYISSEFSDNSVGREVRAARSVSLRCTLAHRVLPSQTACRSRRSCARTTRAASAPRASR